MLIKSPQDMFKLIGSFKNQDPSSIIANMVNEAASQGNPIMQNLAGLIKEGKTDEIENVVRNIAKERGLDYDKEFKAFRNTFKL
jgi:hypothetical protein